MRVTANYDKKYWKKQITAICKQTAVTASSNKKKPEFKRLPQ